MDRHISTIMDFVDDNDKVLGKAEVVSNYFGLSSLNALPKHLMGRIVSIATSSTSLVKRYVSGIAFVPFRWRFVLTTLRSPRVSRETAMSFLRTFRGLVNFVHLVFSSCPLSIAIHPSTLPGSIEAHLVGNLKAKLLIGMDVMGHEAFRLDLDAKKTTELLMYGH
jgi:hypothetical protein